MRSLFWKIFIWFWAAMVLIGLALYFVVLTTRPNPMPAAWRETAGQAVSAYASASWRAWKSGGESALEAELEKAAESSNSIYWLFDASGHKVAGPPLPPRRFGRGRGGPGGPGGEDRGREFGRGLDGRRPDDREPGGREPGGRGPHRGGGPGGWRWPWQPTPPDLSPEGLREVAGEAAAGGEPVFRLAGREIMVAVPCGDATSPRYLFVGLLPQPRFGRTIVTDSSQWLGALVVLSLSGLVCYALVRYLTEPLLVLREATRRLAGGDLAARTHADRVRRRDEVADLGRDFDAMADRIETLVKSERQLLGDISHELRSPLSRLTMALALARRHTEDERVPPEMTGALDRIGRETRRLDALIAQLLELVRLESGDEYAVRELLDLEALAEDVVTDANFEAEAQDKRVEFRSTGPLRLRGTANLLQSALENVVRNACRHTPAGSTVQVSLARSPAPGGPGEEAVFTVRDHGSGVPEESLAQLFRPFYRVEAARDRQSGGVGLGLAITERAIAAHGGSVLAQNAPGGGLQVTLRLPLREPGGE